jgi:outer membrane lipoprotein LolB
VSAALTRPGDLGTRQAAVLGSQRRSQVLRRRACALLVTLVAGLNLCACGSLGRPDSPPLAAEPASTPEPVPAGQARPAEAQLPCEGFDSDGKALANEAQPGQAANATLVAIQGQLSLKLGGMGEQAARGLSLGFFFNGSEQAGQLDLMTPMGSQIAQVSWTADQVWLTDDKGRRRFDSLDELSQQVLGEALPLRALVPWMQGRPARFLPCQRGALPGQFTQDGWQIDTREQASHRLLAQRPASASQRAVLIKFYLDR